MKYVYSFEEGNKDLRDILGGKGANLAEMVSLNLPVPSGFTISTKACTKFFSDGEVLSPNIELEILSKLKELESKTGKKFGNKDNPLLVSVRSGSPVSMPGMMDSILNLGISESVLEGLKKRDERSALDSYRRLICMYAEVVNGFPKEKFSGYINEYKSVRGFTSDSMITVSDFTNIINTLKENYLECGGNYFPDSPREQLMEAVKAVFKSWNNERAKIYRKVNNISESLGTAVNIQEMVYGNYNDQSATGVLFSRNTITGTNEMIGEYLINAQGEDVVAGVRTPLQIESLKTDFPSAYNDLLRISKDLEKHFGDVQDMEFTIENKKLFILQTRIAKRTPLANIKFALTFLDEGLIGELEALKRVNREDLDSIVKPVFDDEKLKKATVLAKGLAASFACASGKLSLSVKKDDKDIILVREETSPDDIDGMLASRGIVTRRGGLSSHAAVIGRGFGLATICGCESITINERDHSVKFDEKTIHEGEFISIDGRTGIIYEGEIPLKNQSDNKEMYDRVLKLIEKYETIPVRANADTKEAAQEAIKLGAKGIGLVRTEHMFFKEERLKEIRKLILSKKYNERKSAIDKLEKFQEDDFYDILKVCDNLDVVIRLLDPPLHEFIPKKEAEINVLKEDLGLTNEEIRSRIDSLKEVNPMMGLRGARLLIKLPEIIKMQTSAITSAYKRLKSEGLNPKPKIMVPLISSTEEFKYIKELIEEKIEKASNGEIKIKVGTMIETPRAAILSQKLSQISSFYSFGTNDLTQMTYGISRDDAGEIVNEYREKNLFDIDPFKELDEIGVGSLISITKKTAKENIEMGMCGEQAASDSGVAFASKLGLDYVSVSPASIIGARLASAKANNNV